MQDLTIGHRQLAALVLKRLVKQGWDRDSKHFKAPELGSDEKSAIKRDLVPGLADPQSKIRIAIGMVIAGYDGHSLLPTKCHCNCINQNVPMSTSQST